MLKEVQLILVPDVPAKITDKDIIRKSETGELRIADTVIKEERKFGWIVVRPNLVDENGKIIVFHTHIGQVRREESFGSSWAPITLKDIKEILTNDGKCWIEMTLNKSITVIKKDSDVIIPYLGYGGCVTIQVTEKDLSPPHNRKVISLEELNENKVYSHNYTVKQLKEFIEKRNIPDTAKILVQRVEDVYYERHSWGVVLKKGEGYWRCIKWNDDIDKGVYSDKDKYPQLQEKDLKKYSKEELEAVMDEYHPVWCAVGYNDDTNNLYLDLHY